MKPNEAPPSTVAFWQVVQGLQLRRDAYDRLYAAAVGALQEQYGRGVSASVRATQSQLDCAGRQGALRGRREVLERMLGKNFRDFFELDDMEDG